MFRMGHFVSIFILLCLHRSQYVRGQYCLKGDDICNETVEKNKFIGDSNVIVYTVATNNTDGYQRYQYSVKQFGIEPIVLGRGEKWKGGENIKSNPGGGWKINLLKNALKSYKADDKDKIILFTDSYDVIFLGNLNDIVDRFKSTGAKVLFGAEPFCWPNVELAAQYPEVDKGQRFLNSGLYIGYLPEILNILNRVNIEDTGDDQLFFTEAYLDESFRKENHIKLDHLSEIFQNVFGAEADLEIITVKNKDAGPEVYSLKNTKTNTQPLVVHGNGLSKLTLNYLSNYLPNGMWNSVDGCKACKTNQIELINLDSFDQWPVVYMAVFVELNTPFLNGFLKKIHRLEYPKNKIHLFVHNAMKYHENHVKNFTEAYGKEYLSLKLIKADDGTPEWAARGLSLDQFYSKKCDYYFAVDSLAHLDNPFTLKLLIEQNRSIVAPMLVRPGKSWSNFWGSLTRDGFYARSNDYMDIVHNVKRGLWNVPYINNAYLINATAFREYDISQITFNRPNMDADMAFCYSLRNVDIFMYVSNRVDFGHLVNPESYDVTRAEPDMYQIFDNEQDWQETYIHPDYPENFNLDKKPKQPCPDVYWFPIVTKEFTKSLISMMENYGKWSSGKNDDDRLEGGYEAVPTRDIHMNQVGWEDHWLYFLHKFVRPLQELVFTGYFHDPPRSLMNFVVRYRPDEQPSLRAHHDSSTYTINIALNEVGKDYEGGGCRFIRYNCSVVDTQMGWMLMHPGRLTHFHEGLLVTKGTRYIMIAFVDP